MKKTVIPALLLAALLLTSCGRVIDILKHASTYVATESVGETEPDSTGKTPDTIDHSLDSVNQEPDIHTDYIPVHNDEVTDPPHIEYPDWSQIKQPEIKELADAEKNLGKRSDNTKIVGKIRNNFSDGSYGMEYLNSEGQVVMLLVYSEGSDSPHTKEVYTYYETGEKYKEEIFDMTMEGKPDFFRIRRKDGTTYLYGHYDNEGHFDCLIVYDEEENSQYSINYFQTGEQKSKYTYYKGQLATYTEFFINGDVSVYEEFDDTGSIHYHWDKYIWEDSGKYRIIEGDGKTETDVSFTADGKVYDTSKYTYIGEIFHLIAREYYPFYEDGDFSYMIKTTFDGTHFISEYYENGVLTARSVISDSDGYPGENISTEYFE